ncbi:MAG: DUF433 domain-containing protein [Alphaproteobacteria bacterium]|nr:DUF433 domain-containing protein [Alphaproteobacteria bacterium]
MMKKANYITKNPDIQNGRACIRDTGIAVYHMMSFLEQGDTEEKLIRGFGLSPSDIVAIKEYYAANKEEIDTQMKEVVRKTPRVQGGKACIRNSRIPVWIIVSYILNGEPDETILNDYPYLVQSDIDAVRDYYAANKIEIDLEITKNESDDY